MLCGRLVRQEGGQAGHHSPPGGPGCPAPLSFGVFLQHFLLSSFGVLRAYRVEDGQEGRGLSRVSWPLLVVQLSS